MNDLEVAKIILGSGSVSAVVTFLLNLLGRRAERRRDRRHQARLVAEHLERHAFSCAAAAFGDWELLVAGRPGALLAAPPQFEPFSDKIVWQAIDGDGVERAREAPAASEAAAAATAAGFGKSRAEGHVAALAWSLRLGQEAGDAAATIRRRYGLRPLKPVAPRWDHVEFLRGELEKLPERRSAIEAIAI